MFRLSPMLPFFLILNILSYSTPQVENGLFEAEAATESSLLVQEKEPAVSLGEPFRDPVTGIEFVFVKGGCFEMGDTFGDGEADEVPVHEVCVLDFFMAKHEVTVGQFREFVKATGYQTEAEKGLLLRFWTGMKWKKNPDRNWQNPGFSQTEQHPVVNLSYNDACAFADWLSNTTGKAYRLPTEAEWEYAARSGGKKEKWAGTNDESRLGEFAWYEANSEWMTHPVGSKKPNALGLFDINGNAWEWVFDRYRDKYYKESPRDNPPGAAGGPPLLRGGSWVNEPWFMRTADRAPTRADWPLAGCGFRLVLSIP